MALVPPATPDQLDPETRRQLERLTDEHGHLELLRRTYAHFPAALGGVDSMYRKGMGSGRLPRLLRELVFVAASEERGDGYCAEAVTEDIADRFGLVRDRIDAMARGVVSEALSEAESDLVSYARKVARAPYKMVPADIARLTDHGWETPDIVEALTIVCTAGYMSTLSQTLHLEDDLVTAH